VKKLVCVKNSSRANTVVGHQVQIAESFLDKLIGLMGRRHMHFGTGLLLRPCSSIHTCFMRMPIDVLYINKDRKVLAIDKVLKPWRVGKIKFGTTMVIELPPGTAAASGIEVGDRLLFDDAWPVATIA
jgi:uncharacterized protein